MEAPVSKDSHSLHSKKKKPMAEHHDQMTTETPMPMFYRYKVAILGERAVGKTSMLTQFLYKSFDPSYQSTIGIDFFSKNLMVDGRTVRLQIWDTAGQERFRSLIPGYIRSASATILVYDVTDRQTFREIDYWIKEVKAERDETVVMLLAGNKTDLRGSCENEKLVTPSEGAKKAEEIGATFIEISAKTGYNVQQLFRMLALMLSDNEIKMTDKKKIIDSITVEAISTDEDGQKKGSWCGC